MKKQQIEQLIDTHQTELYRYLQFLGADPDGAEDIVQETFTAAYFHKNPPDLGNISRRTAWLRAIARNTFFKRCRKAKKDIRMIEEQIKMIDQSWSEAVENRQIDRQREALADCLKGLPEKQSEALNMRYRKRLSRSMMAKQLEMSENGIKSLLQRIRQSLAKCIKKKMKQGVQS